MSADKRSVSTDALETLGTIIDETQKRDAIHLAVIPVQAGEILYQGQDIGIAEDGKAYLNNGIDFKQIGIVDPFLKDPLGIQVGQWFWLIIYPRKITSLRHVWSHPDVPDSEEVSSIKAPSRDKEASKQFIRNYISENCGEDPDEKPFEYYTEYGSSSQSTVYDMVVNTAARHTGKEALSFGFTIYGVLTDEFWEHIGILTGRYIPAADRADGVQCAC